MSSYTFSHQFYQRWTRAPEVIRRAITQELADITTLLQPETRLDTYQFSIEDLDAHLDQLTRDHDAKLKAEAERQALEEKQRRSEQEKQEREARRQKREQAERLAEEKAAKDKQRREEEKARAEQAAIEETKNQAQQEPQNLPADESATTQESDITTEEKPEQQSLADDVDALFEDIRAQNKSADLQENDGNNEKEESQSQTNLASQKGSSDNQANVARADQDQALEAETAKPTDNTAAENLATEINKTKDEADEKQEAVASASEESSKSDEKAPSNETQQDLPESLTIDAKSSDDITQALSNHLDDFLTDKMMQLSEDLKSWLKEEVRRQLAELESKKKQ